LTISGVENVNKRISGQENTLNILNPVNVLKRGYTITTKNGIIIKSAQLAGSDDIIDTQFSDGKIKSRVLKKEETPGHAEAWPGGLNAVSVEDNN
jgi:exodeoxyribonuclease VII large subunit